MSIKRTLLFIAIFLVSSIGSWAVKDEITFFNVGQGHCTLVRKIGHVPLLVDAGSKQNVHRVLKNKPDYKGSPRGEKVINDIIDKITEYWSDARSPNGVLNVIVTHGDADHVN